ncbi:flagellar basal-body MS-ring/collar protein FliF [uncultured Pseudacidovorax sp.]|uniref:flagellar basal-body MS-ring/collar protein FliF n=1 Tax=uncultured Pseudacidovorax sp. TaxID=679313 RepID=UPI0025FA4415|nr:flagellar basal-body MS-ring/collar protein FliF [uncultured Pseudacidovorax sp.]
MSAAAAQLPATSPLPGTALVPAGLASRFAALDRSQRLKLALGAVLLAAVAIAAVVMGRSSDWRVLFSNLNDKDGGAIVAQLAQMNVPYKYTEGGGAIMVPAEKVHDVRLRLASQGLPKGSVTGFELTDTNRFGMTQFQEKLSFQRGLEGELTRSIQALAAVQSARVHLALPNQNGFFREQQKPSASVLLTLHPGRTLDRAQIAGIVHLVASSVPELSPAAVSVVDDSGKLLSATGDANANGSVDAQQLAYVQQLEQSYTRRILDMLEPVVGKQNVKAQVTADVDFSQTEATSEEHRPNLSQDASAVRSQQTIETVGATPPQPSGVPGAASNQPQPPGAPAAPINGQAAPLAPNGAQAQAAAGQRPPGKRESITNYEVDKTVRTVRGAVGNVKRLSAAVVVNYQGVADAQGKITPTALPAAQLEQMTALVRESIGFSKERGDSVNLMNAAFMADGAVAPELPLWKRPELYELARSLAWPAALAVLGLAALFGLVRPALKALSPPKPEAANDKEPKEPLTLEGGPVAAALPGPGGALDAVVGDEPERPAIDGPSAEAGPEPIALPRPELLLEQAQLEGARVMARQNPAAVANIVRGWINPEAEKA